MKSKLLRLFSVILIIGVLSPVSALGQTPEPPDITVADVSPTIVGSVEALDLDAAIKTEDGRVRVIVEFSDPPLATYAGGISGLQATSIAVTGGNKLNAQSAASRAYVNYLEGLQAQFVSELASVVPSATVDYRYQAAFNGLGMAIDATEIGALLKMQGVKRVYPDQMRHAVMDASLDLINAPALWDDLGGREAAGDGIKVAVVDTGIRAENPMFDGSDFSMPPGYPKGYCVTSPGDPDFQCNAKLIAARWYVPTFSVHVSETLSPLDIDGHGSHTAGTATGNVIDLPAGDIVPVTTTISGVAPGAYLMAYKGLFELPDESTASGSDTMLLGALNDALLDGADVISNSWGGGSGSDPNNSPYQSAIQAINAAGVLVVFAAGNSGPGAGTIDCPGCVEEALTVGASTTDRVFANTVDVTGPGTVAEELTGLAGLVGTGPDIASDVEAEIRYSGVISETNFEGCSPFPTGAFSDTIALIQRGSCSFEDKVNNASDAGAVAAVIFNHSNGPPIVMGGLESTTLPSVFMSLDQGETMRDWITDMVTATARINAETSRIVNANWQDIMASFSSVGPNGDPNALKPDITAPGVNILSASSPVLSGGADFEFKQGTSMATPHVAGAAALLAQQHPSWTPMQIKTALTSTSIQEVLKPDGSTDADPFDMGAGRLDLERASMAGLTFSKPSFADGNCGPSCSWLNTSIENVAGASTTWTVSVDAPEGLEVSVSPSEFTLPAGLSGSFDVTADVSGLEPGDWYFASLTWSESTGTYPDAYMPMAVYVSESDDANVLQKSVDVPTIEVGGTVNYTITVANNTSITRTFYLRDPIPDNSSYISGTATGGLMYDELTEELTATVDLAGTAMDVSPSPSPFGYVPLANYFAPFDCSAFCDEFGWLLSGVDFWYNGQHYDSVVWSTNGFIQAGTDAPDITFDNQSLPDLATPNNVIAPLWTDIDMDGGDGVGGGTWYVGNLAAGPSVFTVFEWEDAAQYDDPNTTYTFQIWIESGTDNIWFVYDDITVPSGFYNTTVGVENNTGDAGFTYYYNGSGTEPAVGTDLKAGAVPGGMADFNFSLLAEGEDNTYIINQAYLTNNLDAQSWAAWTSTQIIWEKTYLPMVFKE
jgi:uncharacterized repeat protein (TIGR01451 family)